MNQQRLVEKWRPMSFAEIINQDEAKRDVLNALSRPEAKHFLFIGSPGTGKTSMAECIARHKYGVHWQSYYKEFNASNSRKIDDMREKIIPLLHIKGERIIFMDESDRITPEAQDALRRPLEQTLGTTVIFSANYEHKIIDAIKSRCIIIRFQRLTNAQVKEGLFRVIKGENIKVTIHSEEEKEQIRKGIKYLVESANGDLRKAINSLEKLIDQNKQITVQNIVSLEKPKHAVNAMLRAIQGNFEDAKKQMEDAYIYSGFSFDDIVRELKEGINEENIKDRDLRIRIFIELKELDKACHYGSDPLIQLIGFLAKCYLFPHLQKECPILKESIK